MKKLNLAVIGAGQITEVTHLPIFREMKEVELAALCDTNPDRLNGLGEKFGITHRYTDHKEILSKCRPDAVIICVPNRFHCEITLDCLLAGAHVLCEKPPAIHFSEARKMEEAARTAEKILTYGFHFRHSDPVRMMKGLIDRGELGVIYHTKVVWTRRRGIPGWGSFTNRDLQGGGPLIDIGSHMLDAALYLLHYPKISSVLATAGDRIGKKGGNGLMGSWRGEEFTVEDALFGLVRFDDGTSLSIETAFAVNQKEKEERNILLYGDGAGAGVFPPELYGEREGELFDTRFPFMLSGDWHVKSNQNFVNACLGREEILVKAGEGAYLQKVVDALYMSSRSGKPVEMV